MEKVALKYDEHNYGEVLRSSAIFYFKKSPNFKTTLSFLNYWKIKRDIDVTIFSTIRKMDGTTIKKEQLFFDKVFVINYSPEFETDFEGSIEIEIFSKKDMVIPYAGIMVVYETKKGVSMVHSYSRTYSDFEIETNRTITSGEECCVPIKDSENVESFVVLHNGKSLCPSQEIECSVLNYKNIRKNFKCNLKSLNPFESVKLRFQDYFSELVNFLNNKPGYVSLSFRLEKSFTRLMVVNKTIDDTDFQITHSDFNYSKHQTDNIPSGEKGYMALPKIEGVDESLIVYPDCVPGKYFLSYGNNKKFFTENNPLEIPINDIPSDKFSFEKNNEPMPSRLHTGLRASISKNSLPSEPCLGIFHKLTTPKRFYWGLCASTDLVNSRIILQQYDGGEKEHCEKPVTVRLFSQNTPDFLESSISPSFIKNGQFISDIFPNAKEFLGGSYGWFTIFSHYSRCFVYSTLENNFGSLSIEHSI